MLLVLLVILLMSGVKVGVLPPLFQKTVLLNDAWTAVVTVAGTAIAMVAETVAVSVAGTAGDTAADGAAGTASIISLMNALK